MKSTETSTSSAGRLQRGVLASLGALLPFKGTPTPKIAKGPGARLALGVLFASLLFAAPALAAEAPTIVESSVKSSGETRETANLEAQVNPGGEEVSICTFEYGPSTSYDQQQPCAQTPAEIGAGTEPIPVNAQLTVPNANTEYHWRLTIKNLTGSATTLDHTFVYPTEAGGLPDGRQYELVTPPHKNGAALGETLNNGERIRISEEGGTHVFGQAIQCFAEAGSCDAVGGGRAVGQPFEFTRTATGWAARSFALPIGSAGGSGFFFGQSTSGTAFDVLESAIEPLHPFLSFYVQNALAGGALGDIGPLQPPGTTPDFQAVFVGSVTPHATPSGNHLVYELAPFPNTGVVLWPFDPTPSIPEATGLYEYEGLGSSQPRLVALAPNSSSELVSRCGNALGGENNSNHSGALAEDGETVYFTAEPCREKQEEEGGSSKVNTNTLYARYEHARSELISGPAPAVAPVDGEACDATCRSQPAGNATFEGASSDGSRVFFIDPHQLTDRASEDTNPEETSFDNYCEQVPVEFTGCNLYESECPGRCVNPSERKLVDVSAGDTSGEGPRVQDIMAFSKDGSHVYFVAKGVLTATVNDAGRLPVNGKPNLYVYEHDSAFPAGHLAFVATLSEGVDSSQWTSFDPVHPNVTPDGRFLVFRSVLALTADDTRPEGPSQVYRYDAQTGVLLRVSIGARGFADDGNEGSQGAKIVRPFVFGVAEPERFDPTMSDDGSFVFFQSPDGLTPRALNDVPAGTDGKLAVNVYEWQAPGTSVEGKVQCAEASGCVSLISDGKDLGEDNGLTATSSVELLGSSASGANVIFTTSDALLEQDTNTERDIYDAHICSSAEPCPPASQASPPCLGEVCHGIPAEQQGAPTGGSLTLNGLGNITPAAPAPTKKVTKKTVRCKKGFVKNKRNKCVKRPKKKKSKAKKSAHINRRTSR
jgi:hypothetical protein